MRKFTLLVLAIILSAGIVKAQEKKEVSDVPTTVQPSQEQPQSTNQSGKITTSQQSNSSLKGNNATMKTENANPDVSALPSAQNITKPSAKKVAIESTNNGNLTLEEKKKLELQKKTTNK